MLVHLRGLFDGEGVPRSSRGRRAELIRLRRRQTAGHQLVTSPRQRVIAIDGPAGALEVVSINGRDVTQEIRTVETSKLVSIVATLSGVRAQLRRRQQAWVDQRGGGVVEGRDIATVVFPEALLKVYLTASPRVRAERRVAQIGGDVEVIARELAARDEVDSTRADSPLSAASDSVVVDTSDRTIEDVVAEIVGLFEARLASWQK
ncbi:MAG: hypothetical protein EBS70_03360 [Actinobacteria bacterium]|nr:hypothetical protein [Actinomycetota bacterium]